MNRFVPLLGILLLAGCGEGDAPQPVAPEPVVGRGVVTRRPGVTDGYVLFSPLLSDRSYLIDNDGQVVHLWQSSYSPGGGQYLLPNGNLLRPGRDPEMLGFRSGGTGGILQEIAWNGDIVWEWRLSNERHVLHHDVEPLPNGNILAIAWEVKTPEEARAAGRRADLVPEQGLWPDWLLEIEPVRPDGARIVWKWHVWDHLVQNHDPAGAHYGEPAAHPHRLDINAGGAAHAIDPQELARLKALGYVPSDAAPEDLESDFLHINAVAYHPQLEQIALSVPELGEVWVLDHAVSHVEASGPAGDLLYRWGNPATYDRGDADGQRFFYQHDVRWIPDGWEGAGNITVLNNGRDRPSGLWTSVDEWTLPIDAEGRYPISEGEPWGPSQLAWQYRAADPESLYAPFISGAQRIENGNTLLCAGTEGRFIEVTKAGEVVWEYRNPYGGSVRNEDGTMPQPGLDEFPTAVFRATRIPADDPGLAGKLLAPREKQPEWWEPNPVTEPGADGS